MPATIERLLPVDEQALLKAYVEGSEQRTLPLSTTRSKCRTMPCHRDLLLRWRKSFCITFRGRYRNGHQRRVIHSN
jgi:hypothetical protein